MQPPPYLVSLFTVTAGQNGENLGSDEEQVVFFVYLLYDVPNNKVSSQTLFIIHQKDKSIVKRM